MLTLESYTDRHDLQFTTIATAFGLVLATAVAGAPVGKAVRLSYFFVISCETHPMSPSAATPSETESSSAAKAKPSSRKAAA